jgi:phosphate transport system substrate-binding protein
VVAACGGLGGTASPSPDPLAGNYSVRGGGAALDVFQALAEAFRKAHPAVRFEFEDVGSAAGMRLAASADVDLATSSATPAPDIAGKVTAVSVGSSGTAVVVNIANPVTNLTKAEVRGLFSGSIPDWSQVGGTSGKVIVAIREDSSAIRSNFDAYFFGGAGTFPPNTARLNTADEVINAVEGSTRIVSMLTIDAKMRAHTQVRAIAIDGVAPTRENLKAGTYPVRRPLFLVYNSASAKPAIRSFIEFVQGPEGQRLIDIATAGL